MGAGYVRRWHIHCAIELPSHCDAVGLERLIGNCWAKVEWGIRIRRKRSGKRTPLGYSPEDSAKLPMHFITRWKVKVFRRTRQSEINTQPIGEC